MDKGEEYAEKRENQDIYDRDRITRKHIQTQYRVETKTHWGSEESKE